MRAFPAFLVLFVASFSQVLSISILGELTKFFQTVVEKGFGEKSLNKKTLSKLLNLFDGNPKYNEKGVEYLLEKLGIGADQSITFEFFHEVVAKIYGDMISDDPFQPQEIHLALTANPSEMKVMWITMENLESPFVQYQVTTPNMDWEEKNRRISTLTAVNYTYSVTEKWWPVFNGVIYEANMAKLEPERKYSYRVGGYDTANKTVRYSDVFTFISAPDHTDPSRVTKVYTVADHGTFELLGFETVKKMVMMINESTPLKDNRPDFIFAAGDLSYAGLSSEIAFLNISKEDEFELIWDLLGIQNQPVAANIPWMVGNGNHERFYNWSAFTNRYHMPNNNPALPSNGGFWYTFTYGNIQWISLSSEHPLDASSEQYAFLTQALDKAVANRDNVPWIILTLHKPFYCSVDGSPSFKELLEPILIEYDVDLTLTGHMHAYERIHPVKEGQVTVYPSQEFVVEGNNKQNIAVRKVDTYHSTGFGPVHVMQGHAGGMQFERFIQPQPDWSAFRMANGLIPPNISAEHSVRSEWNERYPNDILNLFDDLNCVNNDPNNARLCEIYQTLPLLTAKEFDLATGFNYSHTFGFGYIQAINSTHLLYEMVPNVDGILNHDRFWIVKDHKAVKKTAVEV